MSVNQDILCVFMKRGTVSLLIILLTISHNSFSAHTM